MPSEKPRQCNTSEWVTAYADQLFKYAYLRINNREEAEDMVQETFLSALKGLESFRHDCTEKTWLFNILNRKIIDHYRKKDTVASKNSVSIEGNEQDFFNQYFKQSGAKGHWLDTVGPRNWSNHADAKLESDEFMRILQWCMSRLPDLWATVFRLKNLEDKDNKEICKELKINTSNLWVVVHRAKLQLRACMEKKWNQA